MAPHWLTIPKGAQGCHEAGAGLANLRGRTNAGEQLDQLGRNGRGRQAIVQSCGQRAAGTVLQREEQATAVLSDVMDLHDVGVMHARDDLCLGAKTSEVVRSRLFSREKHFQRDQAIEAALPGLEDNSHAAPAQFVQDLVPLRRERLRHSGSDSAWNRLG